MKLLVGRMMAASVLVSATAATAQAQAPRAVPAQAFLSQDFIQRAGSLPYLSVSDVGGPYAGMAPEYVPPHYGPVPLLPPREIFMIVRENGYAPLGPPQPRGMFYTITVIDGDGEDGRLVIDARNGRILQFLPAFRTVDRMDNGFAAEMPISRPPAIVPNPQALMPPQAAAPMPPVSMAAPAASVRRSPIAAPRRLASQSSSTPLPKPVPRAIAEPNPPRAAAEPKPVEPLATAPAAPAPSRQSAVAPPKPVETSPPSVTTGQAGAKSSGEVMSTQPMPQVQGLD